MDKLLLFEKMVIKEMKKQCVPEQTKQWAATLNETMEDILFSLKTMKEEGHHFVAAEVVKLVKFNSENCKFL